MNGGRVLLYTIFSAKFVASALEAVFLVLYNSSMVLDLKPIFTKNIQALDFKVQGTVKICISLRQWQNQS